MGAVARWSARLLVSALALAAAGCNSTLNVPYQPSGTPESDQGGRVSAVVVLKNVSFNPSVVTISVGQTVEWVWEDNPIPHNVTFDDFASPTQQTGTFFHTFNAPGVYHYRCTIHATMVGTVVVNG